MDQLQSDGCAGGLRTVRLPDPTTERVQIGVPPTLSSLSGRIISVPFQHAVGATRYWSNPHDRTRMSTDQLAILCFLSVVSCSVHLS